VALVVLAVNANQAALSATKEILESSGYLVVCASDYGEAKQRLADSPPDLLVTAVKLGAYNGLQLVIRASTNPKIPAIVTGDRGDTALQNEAEKLNAVYLPEPVERDSLIALVEQVLARMDDKAASSPERRWPRKPADIPVQVGDCDARLVDASYGGLRLEFSGPPGERPQRIDAVSISRVGSVSIHPVWTRGGPGTPSVWWCGVEVTPAERKAGSPWRTFVDSLH
jgi:CheY-like chemotaxis protein